MLGLTTEAGCAPPSTNTTVTSSAKTDRNKPAANIQNQKPFGEVSLCKRHARISTQVQNRFQLRVQQKTQPTYLNRIEVEKRPRAGQKREPQRVKLSLGQKVTKAA